LEITENRKRFLPIGGFTEDKFNLQVIDIIDSLPGADRGDEIFIDWNNPITLSVLDIKVYRVLVEVKEKSELSITSGLEFLKSNKYPDMNWSDKETEVKLLEEQIQQRLYVMGALFFALWIASIIKSNSPMLFKFLKAG
jgi:hypothetical protein